MYKDRYEKWKETEDYYCISGITVLSDESEYEIEDEIRYSYNVYKEVNEKGAILCDFYEYGKTMMK